MTSQLLSLELSTLIQESKRRNPDLRNAAEKSLTDLKALPNTSEAQLAADLKRRPNFVRPFVLACRTQNPKLASNGITGLLRLVVSAGLSSESLNDVLQAFRDCSNSSLDVQLKVLQALPPLLQNYAQHLKGGLLIFAFQVCFSLHGSKTTVVSNTAAASLQQLLAFTFENVAAEDGLPSGDKDSIAVPLQEESVDVHRTASDAYHLLNEICLLTEGSRPKLLNGATLTPEFGLELLESLLVVHIEIITRHEEDIHILRSRLMPLITRVLSEKASFNVTVRSMRLLRLLVRELLPSLTAEIEMAINLIHHLLDLSTTVTWKRVLCLELFRDFHHDLALIRSLFTRFDLEKGRKKVVGDHLAVLVRLAAEKPAVIGLGQSSSRSETQGNLSAEQIAIEAGGLSGAVGVHIDELSLNKPGLNTRWSTVRTSCIDQIDKTEPPVLPATYLYSLVLTCINRFSDGLAKYLLPFTLQSANSSQRKYRITAKQKGQNNPATDDNEDNPDNSADIHASANVAPNEKMLPVNPLTLEEHEQFDQIQATALMVENCWPALLATSSTFLNASLDSEYYHALIRSVQRFTQIAGLLNLVTPRDAFLTTLAKQAVPSGPAASMNTPVVSTFKNQIRDDASDGDEKNPDFKSAPNTPSTFPKHFHPSLTPRNLLCLRALLNLGTALGPVLQESWAIIFQSLHQVDVALIAMSHRPILQSDIDRTDEDDTPQIDGMNVEKNAVETAVSRLFQSTSVLPNREFVQALRCLCSLTYSLSRLAGGHESEEVTPNVVRPKHHRFPSTSGGQMNDAAAAEDILAILDRTMQMIQCNTARLIRTAPSDSGWSIFTQLLIDHLSSSAVVAEVRINAARNLNETTSRLMSFASRGTSSQQDEIMSRCLEALSTSVSCLWKSKESIGGVSCSLEIQFMVLAALLSLLEQGGETLRSCWDVVFLIINSVFERTQSSTVNEDRSPFEVAAFASRSAKLVRSAFAALQLICSDFLTSLPDRCFLMLFDTLHCFCSQRDDLNVSLTSVALSRNVSDFLLRDGEEHGSALVDANVARCNNDKDLIQLTNAHNGDTSKSAIWVCLILHLAHLFHDSRIEVRHSALRTLFGIFHGCSNRLDAEAWKMSFHLIFLRLLSATEVEVKETSWDSADGIGWVDSAVLLLESVSKTFVQSVGPLAQRRCLSPIWERLLARYTSLLDRQHLDLCRTIFDSLSEIFVEIERTSCTNQLSFNAAWNMWSDSNPTFYDGAESTDNNDAIVAYLHCITQLHCMLPSGLDSGQAEDVMINLRLCIIKSGAAPYGSDVNEMTAVQNLSFEVLDLLPMSTAEVLTRHVEEVAALVTLAFQNDNNGVHKGKSYIALSKAAMETLDKLMKQPQLKTHPSVANLLASAFHALEVPISLKYKWQRQGKGMPTWKKATATFLSMLDADCIRGCSGDGKDKQRMWEAIANINDGIVAAETEYCESASAITMDQLFDIESFSTLQNIIIPTLGSPSIPDKIRRRYITSLFEHSIIHDPHPDDLARPGQELLDGLRSQHVGRVQELPPKRRSKMAYVLLDQLFDLAAVHDGSVKRVRLAQIAAPYLILRVGLVLKAYACDQPLRGLMPQPVSQKREMHYVLKKLVDLNSEPKAIPETSGVQSEHKKHLFLLFSLITKALKAARKDEEMRAALMKVLDAVGMDFGF